jgi:hypothetical protein
MVINVMSKTPEKNAESRKYTNPISSSHSQRNRGIKKKERKEREKKVGKGRINL